MNLLFWLNSTFLHCSYLTLFTPQIFLYHYCFHCLPGSTVVSRETESEENSYAFFFFLFFFLEDGEVGGEKGVLQWWIVEKKASLLGWNLFHKLYTLFLVLLLISVGVISSLRLPILLSFQYPSTSSLNKSKKLGVWSNSYGISCLTVVGL